MSGEGTISANPTCQRCAISSWHPEARSCTATDCELRAHPALETGAAATPPAAAPGVANDAAVHDRALSQGRAA